jgi:hypothetical protein
MEKNSFGWDTKYNQVKHCNQKNKEINPNSPYLKIWIQGWNSEQRCKSSKVLDLEAVKSSQRKYKYGLKYTSSPILKDEQ